MPPKRALDARFDPSPPAKRWHGTVECLPTDLISMIFEYLPTKTMANAARVCRNWNKAVKRMFKRQGWERVVISYVFDDGELDMYCIRTQRANVDACLAKHGNSMHNFMNDLLLAEFPQCKSKYEANLATAYACVDPDVTEPDRTEEASLQVYFNFTQEEFTSRTKTVWYERIEKQKDGGKVWICPLRADRSLYFTND